MKKKNLLMTAIAIFGLASITMAQTIPSYVPTVGLVGWWPFNGNANDESVNGNNGIVNGPILTTDRFSNPNSAYQFNRSAAQSIDIMNNVVLDSITELTLSIWYNIQSYNDPSSCCGYNHFINKSDQSTQNHFLFAGNNTGLYFYYDNSSAFQTNTLTSLNQWNNVVLTYEYNGGPASMCRFYLNGVLTDSFPTTSQLVSSNFNLRFGTYGSNAYNTVDGTIDDIGIWNRALTSQEVTALYTSSSVGINESPENKLFSVYPNPAKSEIHVKADATLLGSAYTVYDNIGKIVLTGKIHSENTVIELSNLTSGIYLLSVGENIKQSIEVIKK